MVTKFEAEREISWDHGKSGSIAEDCFFAMIALKKGHSFDFIDGEMEEKSTFTVGDYINQRKRWLQGLYLVVTSPEIPMKYKFFVNLHICSVIASTISIWNLISIVLFPLLSGRFLGFRILTAFISGVFHAMSVFGVAKTVSLKKLNFWQLLFRVIGVTCLLPFDALMSLIYVYRAMSEDMYSFCIVDKSRSNVEGMISSSQTA